MASLCHPWFTTTNFSYRFPIFETSATALCGTTGRWGSLTINGLDFTSQLTGPQAPKLGYFTRIIYGCVWISQQTGKMRFAIMGIWWILFSVMITSVGYDAPQSSLIFYRYDMWIQRADTNTVEESSGRFWGLVVGDISTQRSTILSIDHSIVHHISKAETPHPIDILGSSDNFEGLKLSNLFNLMGLSQKLEHQISIVNHGSSSFYQYTAII